MRDPIHWIKPHEPRTIPRAPCNFSRFSATHRRLHQRPAAQDDEYSDRMESEARHFEPSQSQNRQRTRCEVAPVRRRKHAMLEVGAEKVKIGDNENCQAL